MRLFPRILSVLLILSVINCSKHENPTISIVGTWTAVSLTTDCANTKTTEIYSCPATGNALCYKLLFGANGSYLIELSSIVNGIPQADTYSGVYTIKGDVMSTNATNSSGQTFANIYTFILSSSKLTITSQNTGTGCASVIVFTR